MFHVVVEGAEEGASAGRVDCDSEWKPATATTEEVGFLTGNPAVETVRGKVRLFRNSSGSGRPVPNSRMLCILAVPSYISAGELVRFVCGFSSPSQLQSAAVRYIRLLRDANAPARYMAVVAFATQSAADDFFVSHNRRRFNPLETEVAQLFYVSDIEVFVAAADPSETASADAPSPSPLAAAAVAVAAPTRKYEAAPDLTELPTCPVCLERMDAESSGLLTILCNHTFHGECLAQWRDSGCPVCRYALQPLGAESACEECGCTMASELWICLVCGHIGCGRGMRSHALDHAKTTRHTYSLNLETKRVWDYTGDNWVHRVVQAKADGKLVEVCCSPDAGCEGDWKDSEKAVALELEYSRLVQVHLAAFERELTSLKHEKAKAVAHLERQKTALTKQRDEAEAGLESLRAEALRMRNRAERAEAEIEAVEAKLRAANRKLAAAATRAEELEVINKSLVDNQRLWAEKLVAVERSRDKALKDAKAHAEELEGQIRDLMFHIDSQQRVGHEADMQQGDLVTTQAPQPEAPRGRRSSPTRSKQRGRH